MNVSRLFNKQFMKCLRAKYSTHPFKFLEIQETWRRKDNVPKTWELIYRAPMERLVNWGTTYITVTSGACVIIGLYYTLFSTSRFDPNSPIFLGQSDIIIADNLQECLVYLGAYILIHAAVKRQISKYVLRIYKNEDQYLTIFRGHYFNSIKKYQFNLKDFSKLNPKLAFGWPNARYSLGKKEGIIFQQHFRSPAYYNQLLHKNKVFEE